MFKRRGFGNPIVTVISTVLSALLILVLLYILYRGVIVGDSINADGVVQIFQNVVRWAVNIAKGIGNFIIELFGGGGPDEVLN